MPQAHCWMDSKSQFLVSVPQLLCWLCSHIFLPPLLGSVQQEWGQEGGGTRKVLALGSCWHWEGDITAYPVVASSARSLPSRCVPVGEAGCWFACQADPAYKHRAG